MNVRKMLFALSVVVAFGGQVSYSAVPRTDVVKDDIQMRTDYILATLNRGDVEGAMERTRHLVSEYPEHKKEILQKFTMPMMRQVQLILQKMDTGSQVKRRNYTQFTQFIENLESAPASRPAMATVRYEPRSVSAKAPQVFAVPTQPSYQPIESSPAPAPTPLPQRALETAQLLTRQGRIMQQTQPSAAVQAPQVAAGAIAFRAPYASQAAPATQAVQRLPYGVQERALETVQLLTRGGRVMQPTPPPVAVQVPQVPTRAVAPLQRPTWLLSEPKEIPVPAAQMPSTSLSLHAQLPQNSIEMILRNRFAHAYEVLVTKVPGPFMHLLTGPLPAQYKHLEEPYSATLAQYIAAQGQGGVDYTFIQSILDRIPHESAERQYMYLLQIRYVILSTLFNLQFLPYRSLHQSGAIWFGDRQHDGELGTIDVDNTDSKAVANMILRGEDTNKRAQNLVKLYKIHLNPNDQAMDYIVVKLFDIAHRHADFFQKNKIVFKILTSSAQARKETESPAIVLYAVGKQAAQDLLNFIYENFKNDAHMGCDFAPGFNERVTDLIFFAQGDRGVKGFVYAEDLFEEPDRVYYRQGLTRDRVTGAPDDYHLINPNPDMRPK